MIPTPSHSPRAPPNSAHGHWSPSHTGTGQEDGPHHHHHTLASSCRSPDSRMMKDGLTACVSVTRAVGARASSMLPPTLESSLGAEIDHEISSDQSLAPPLDGVDEPGGGAGGVAGGAAGGLGHTRHQVSHLLLHGLVTWVIISNWSNFMNFIKDYEAAFVIDIVTIIQYRSLYVGRIW